MTGRHDSHLPGKDDCKAWAPGALADDDPAAQRELARLQGIVRKMEAKVARDSTARDERGKGRRK